MSARSVYSRQRAGWDRYHATVTAGTVLPLAFVGVLVTVFLVLILLGRPQGFVRIASIVSGFAVVVLGLATLGSWILDPVLR